MEDDNIVVSIIERVIKGDLVGAAEAVVLIIAQERDRDGGAVGLELFFHSLLAVISAAVIDDDNSGNVFAYSLIELRKHPDDLLFAVIHWDEQKYLIHGILLFSAKLYKRHYIMLSSLMQAQGLH